MAAPDFELCSGMIRGRSLVATLIVGLSALTAAGPAWSDQSDPSLPGLFAQLQAAASADEAQVFAAQIWNIWMQAHDPAADRLMATGAAAMNTGDYGSALETFGRLVEAKPNFAEGWNKRATVLYLLGRYQESAADVAKVLALEPRHFGALSGLALCDERLGKDADALQALRQLAVVFPEMRGLKERIRALTKKVEGEPI